MRQFYRFELNGQGPVSSLIAGEEVIPVHLRNLGRGGVCISTSANPVTADNFTINIRTPGGVISRKASPVWKKNITAGEKLIGLRFAGDFDQKYYHLLSTMGEEEIFQKFLVKDFAVVPEDGTIELVNTEVLQKIRPVVVVDARQRALGILDYKSLLELQLSELSLATPVARFMNPVAKNDVNDFDLRALMMDAINRQASFVPIYSQGSLTGLMNVAPAMAVLRELMEITQQVKRQRRAEKTNKVVETLQYNHAAVLKLSEELQRFMELIESASAMGLPDKISELTKQSEAVVRSGIESVIPELD